MGNLNVQNRTWGSRSSSTTTRISYHCTDNFWVNVTVESPVRYNPTLRPYTRTSYSIYESWKLIMYHVKEKRSLVSSYLPQHGGFQNSHRERILQTKDRSTETRNY